MDSAPAGATRMGSRSSTRHGGPAQVFVGRVRKWRKVWSPISSSSPSPSATRVVLYKWSPLAPANGGVKDDSAAISKEAAAPPSRLVNFIPVSVMIQKSMEELAIEALKETAAKAGNEEEEIRESTDVVIETEEPNMSASEEKVGDPKL